MIDLVNLPSSPFKSLNYFNEQLMINWATSSRERLSLSLFIIEIDDFKLFSKTHDTSEVNGYITSVANAFNKALLRQSDFLSQFTPHSLIFLATEMNFKQASQFAEKFHRAIADIETTDLVTVSIGHATCIPESNNCEGPQSFIESAQKQLENAIKAGGNCSKSSLKFKY